MHTQIGLTMADCITTLPLLLLILCFTIPSSTPIFTNETDFHSLLAFKSAIDDDPQGALISWNETTHFCSWNGIQCGRRHRDRVVAINLTSQGLVGAVSSHVGNLSFLRVLFLLNNTFHGQIPREISLLRKLEILNLKNNSFIGAIPRNLSHCPNLVRVNLLNNELSGTIPPELGSLSNLEALILGQNTLSGSIPPSIGNLTRLLGFSVLSCGLTGKIPESFSQLQNLELFQVSNNRLSGTVPSGLFNISTMVFFYVADNQFHGVIPSTIGLTLPNLSELLLWGNQFRGPIPPSISNSSLLGVLELASNFFIGDLPRSFGMLTNLQYFSIQSNLIADDISLVISSLTNATNLVILQVGQNLLTGSLPATIGNLSIYLDTLQIAENKIRGKIPSSIGNLISLTSITFYDNYLEGPIPVDIGKLSSLNVIVVGENKLTDKLPSSLGNLTILTRLYMNENNLSGNVPPSLGNCTRMLELDLSHNNLNGLIPPEIMRLSTVSVIFNLSWNDFEGSIPQEVSFLRNLGMLDLSNNRLSGPIPNSVAKCKLLQLLYLNGNLLEGEIPQGMNDLLGLQELDLSRNNLSGPIPSFLGKLHLQKLNISFNSLNGEVPTIGVFKNKTSFSLDGNRELCGGISELKLHPCSQIKSKRKISLTMLKILIPILASGGLGLVIVAAFTYKQRISRKNATTPASLFTGVQIMRLSYGDLLRATGGFSKTNLIGVGRFGSVYRGVLEDGQPVVAVKVLNLLVRGSSRSFLAECIAIRNVRHRNLLKILSVCESIDFQGNEFKALVYEFKANGSLEKWLHQSDEEGEQSAETKNLNMMQRLNIAVDIAEAIEYLHSGTDISIVHGDLKPSNILLDEDMTAYVGDFGLAKIISDIVPSQESNSTTTGIRGTIGYVPPEYGTSRLVSTQGDVYSYGVVLLEMFTNIRPTDDLFEDRVNIHCFVSDALPNRLMDVVDPQLQTRMNNDRIKSCMASILSIGVSCSKEMARERMSMTDAVIKLHKIQKLLSR